jgi:hypothetical protein
MSCVLPSDLDRRVRQRLFHPKTKTIGRFSKQIDRPPIGGRASTLLNRHPLIGQLLLRMLVLGKMRQTHTTQHIWSLGELDVVVADDLDAVAPGVAKV